MAGGGRKVGSSTAGTADLVRWRRRGNGLVDRRDDPSAVVRDRLAVQAQDHRPALWSVGQRCRGLTEADLDRWFDAGLALRTHVLRPTWHLVAPEDIRWLLTLTAPRVQQLCGTAFRQLGLDAATRDRAAEVMADALGGGRHLTKSQLGEVLAGRGFVGQGVAMQMLTMHAELEQVICSGAMSGRWHTFALLDERVAASVSVTPEDPVAELVRRYLSGHGPATLRDLAWWASLGIPLLRRTVHAMGDELERIEVGPLTYWAVAGTGGGRRPPPRVDLLPTFDEYIIGFTESRGLVVPYRLPASSPGRLTNTLVVDGLVVGTWRRRLAARRVEVDIELYRELTPTQERTLEAAVARYGRFLGRASTIGDGTAPRSPAAASTER